MRLALSPSRRTLLAVVPFLAGCASVGPRQATDSPAQRFLAVRDSLGEGMRVDAGEVPHIRVVVTPSAGSGFVDAAFHVSEPAYAFVAVVDLDRRIRVLFPETPSDVGIASPSDGHRLNRFFAGFGGTSLGSGSRYRLASYNTAFSRITPFEGGGVIVAIASERPLQLDRLSTADGDWDENALQEYLFNTTATYGARTLGRALTVTGQEFTSDVQSIGGMRNRSGTFGFSSGCVGSTFGFDDDFAFGGYGGTWGQENRAISRVPVGQFMVGSQQVVRYAETDACGRVTYIDIPVFVPRTPTDTAAAARAVPRAAFRLPAATDGESASPWRRGGGQAEGTPWSRASDHRALRPADASDARGRSTVGNPAVRGDTPRIEPRARTHDAARPAERRETSPSRAEVREAQPRREPAPAPAPAARPAVEPRPHQ